MKTKNVRIGLSYRTFICPKCKKPGKISLSFGGFRPLLETSEEELRRHFNWYLHLDCKRCRKRWQIPIDGGCAVRADDMAWQRGKPTEGGSVGDARGNENEAPTTTAEEI